jgi:hypothetical protein
MAMAITAHEANSLAAFLGAFDEIPPWSGEVENGFTVNFLGVKRSVDYFIGVEREALAYAEAGSYHRTTERPKVTDGEVFFEWLDIFEAVRAAQDRFTMVELGAGYAARTVNAHAALQKLNPLPAKFVVVEGDTDHFAWAREHALRNGLNPDQHWFINTLVSDNTKPHLFMSAPGRYCNMIVNDTSTEAVYQVLERSGAIQLAMTNLMKTGSMNLAFESDDPIYRTPTNIGFVSSLDLNTILQPLEFIDLMDVDIQHAEREVIPASIDQLNAKVRRLHVGTHSPEIHAELESFLGGHGWQAVFSYPPASTIETPYGAFKTSDGILTFTNPRL